MKNLTLSVDGHLLKRSREHAASLGKTLNQLVRDLLATAVEGDSDPLEEMLALADRMDLRSENGPMSREETHYRGKDLH